MFFGGRCWIDGCCDDEYGCFESGCIFVMGSVDLAAGVIATRGKVVIPVAVVLALTMRVGS